MKKIVVLIGLLLTVTSFAQVDRKDVRRGNRQFGKAKYGDADISYRKGLNADTTSVPAAYNLANNLYRQENFSEAGKYYQQALRHVPEVGRRHQDPYAFDTYFNAGDAALKQKQYRAAMDCFVRALIIDPDHMEAKENYFYARKMLENNPDGGGEGNDQNQDQNQDQDQQDQKQDQQPKDQNQDQGQDQQPKPYGGSEISPQQAQQMLQAIQAQERQTQDKVNKEKAAALKSRQKEKNW